MGREKHMNRTDEILLPMYLQARDKQYDPKERTTTRYRGVNGYHSRLKDRIVHDIRVPLFMQESCFYSVGKKICRESMIFYIG